MKTMLRNILISLLVCSAAAASHTNSPSRDWKGLREKNLSCGFSVERVDQTLEACRKSGLSVKESDALLCSVYAAQAEALPTTCVFLKIEEGLAKRIPADQVRAAAEKRLNCLRLADQLVLSARKVRGRQHHHLVMHACMALESGLPEEVLQHVFNRPGGFRYGRLIHVVEAGEALQLVGLSPEYTQQIMDECLDRDLKGAEVMRVVEVIQRGLQEGEDFKTLHDTLWVSSNAACSGQ